MTWLLLDAGNSAVKWALVAAVAPTWPSELATGMAPRRGGAVATAAPELAAELAHACALARQLDAASASTPADSLDDPRVPMRVIACGVVSDLQLRAIEAALAAAGAAPVVWFGAEAVFDHAGIALRNAYRESAQMGADRWHALIGARACFPGCHLAVVCAGTATTVDGVRSDGQVLGGTIAPGPELMRLSLAQGTARLPLADGDYVAHPDHTDDAIRTGILDAQLGLLERRVRRIRAATGSELQVVLSGGYATWLAHQLQAHSDFERLAVVPDLVLRGLWHRARAQRGALSAQSRSTGPSPESQAP